MCALAVCGVACVTGCGQQSRSLGPADRSLFKGPEEGSVIGGGGEDSGVGGGGEDSDVGVMLSDDVVGMAGERLHLRGGGLTGAYDCDVHWSLSAQRNDDLCTDCQYAFEVVFSMVEEESSREGYACADVWGDEARQVGLVSDYFGYGAVVVGIFPEDGMTYMLGEADVSTDGISWRYGYIDEPSNYESGVYYSWYYRVDASWE